MAVCRRTSECEGPVVRTRLLCLRNSKEASVAGAEYRRRSLGATLGSMGILAFRQ